MSYTKQKKQIPLFDEFLKDKGDPARRFIRTPMVNEPMGGVFGWHVYEGKNNVCYRVVRVMP